MQTLYAYSLTQVPAFEFLRERWETPDDDFIDLDWLARPQDGAPLVVLFHGLEGCSSSHYAISLFNELRRIGWAGVVSHFRGCSGQINRLPRAYHSGDTVEMDWILRRLKDQHSNSRIFIVGVSLGGNVLLKWLGEQAANASSIVDKAVAVSAPIDLQAAGHVLDHGWNKFIYTRQFLRTMKEKALHKIVAHGLALEPAAVRAASTFREFDDLYTAPLHGFRNTDDYWHRASSKSWLQHIRVPTLLLNARNDPFLPDNALPSAEQVSDAVVLEYPESGGHVGFVTGNFPGDLTWLPRRILHFLVTDNDENDS